MILTAAGVILLAAAPRTAFDHRKHFEVAPATAGVCAACHVEVDTADSDRPGVRDHKGCDGADCHAKQFYGPPDDVGDGSLCRVCHLESSPWADMSELQPFPRADGVREYCMTFDHRLHVAEHGLDCAQCHKVRAHTRSVAPMDHGDCDDCHAEGKSAGERTMQGCDGCHRFEAPSGVPVCAKPRKGWDRVRFPHDKHRVDPRDGSAVGCDTCHEGVVGARKLSDMDLIATKRATMKGVCGALCHTGRLKVDGKALFGTRDCARCHPDDDDPAVQPGAEPPVGH